jgi:Flp pilus assembly protein TadB
VWPYRHAGAGRREFGRVVLVSLAASARAELETHRARGRKLRARRAERRLAELEEALERLESGAPPRTRGWHDSAAAEAATASAFVATVVVLAAAVAMRGPAGLLVGALDAAMLLAAVTWFLVAVGRRARPRGGTLPPPNEGYRSGDGGR